MRIYVASSWRNAYYRGNGGRFVVHVPEKHPLLYSREYENARRKIIEAGHLYVVHVYTDTRDCLTFVSATEVL